MVGGLMGDQRGACGWACCGYTHLLPQERSIVVQIADQVSKEEIYAVSASFWPSCNGWPPALPLSRCDLPIPHQLHKLCRPARLQQRLLPTGRRPGHPPADQAQRCLRGLGQLQVIRQ